MLKYLLYILKHKYNVFKQGIKLLQFCNWLEKIQLIVRLIVHDYSKFTFCEFFAYYLWFYKFKDKRDDKLKTIFDMAWNYHQKYNDHHWGFWVIVYGDNTLVSLPIPKVPLLEMMADWASIKGKFRLIDIEKDNGNYSIILHSKTKKELEEYLVIFKELDI